ncbi:hypothetical protein [Duganella aceris]|uniref:O-antigen ligase domain-containing protein n=1 Tax=Duganella aceris TaxID=2703883 RepID=A0ABX0FR12_9BURK|nr:hypothetical protein [Duganella aceris]NGZ87086.1 hypothetical protein [Duganella aceris]
MRHMAWSRLLSLLFFAGAALAIRAYPMQGSWLSAILAGYTAMLWWRPVLWLFAMPALLPALDLAPLTGWFFLEEIDLLLLIGAGFAYWQLEPADPDLPRWPPLFIAGLLLLAACCAIGLWRGLRPLPAFDANAMNNYLSPYNALRIGKAWLWSFILLPPLRRAAGAQLQGVRRYLISGLLTGLLLVVCAAIRERWQFPGLTNFSSDYRITAPFSAMHTGGAALDGYLALCFPLLAVYVFGRPARLKAAGALALLALTLYAGLSTFSRGLYLAFAVAVLVLLFCAVDIRRCGKAAAFALIATVPLLAAANWVFAVGGYRGYAAALMVSAVVILAATPRRHVAAALATMLLLASIAPIYNGYFVNQRFSSSGEDLARRVRHWRQTLSMMDEDGATAMLGMGLGKFPATYYWRNHSREVPPSYRYLDAGNNRYLRLVAGDYPAGYGELLRILQSVDLRPRRQYLLGVDIWNNGPPGFLRINLCERQLLYPQNCLQIPMRQVPHAPYWQRYQFPLNSGVLGTTSRPVWLEIAAEGVGAVIDIDNVSLSGDNHELLRNGGFSDANNYWFFSSDRNHLPWHIKNLGLNLYFEMGGAGVLAYAMLLFSVCLSLLRRIQARRDLAAAALLASLAAFHTVGLFDSLIDVPRITLLSTLLMCAAALRPVQTDASPSARLTP